MHQRFIHWGMGCVDGVLKCIFNTQTVAQTDSVIRINVNTMYLPNRGMANEVDGIVSISTDKKNMSDTSMEMVRVTCLSVMGGF